jgi:hypothetical protein
MKLLNELTNGSIVRFLNDNTIYVAIHYTKSDINNRKKINKNIKNYTGYYLFNGLWYEGSPLTSEPYGKCIGQLEVGMCNNLEIIGHVKNNNDFNKYFNHNK